MDIKYKRHSDRQDRALIFWKQVVSEYNAGKSASQIASSYINPKTGKFYKRQWIYSILKKMQAL